MDRRLTPREDLWMGCLRERRLPRVRSLAPDVPHGPRTTQSPRQDLWFLCVPPLSESELVLTELRVDTVKIKNTKTGETSKLDLVVMEHLFHAQSSSNVSLVRTGTDVHIAAITRQFDLKGVASRE